MEAPYKRIGFETRYILESNRYLPQNVRDNLPQITYEQIKQFASTLFEVFILLYWYSYYIILQDTIKFFKLIEC
jgi:hypothetical protein